MKGLMMINDNNNNNCYINSKTNYNQQRFDKLQ